MKHLKTLFVFMLTLMLSIGQIWATDYQLVTSTDDLVADAHYVMGATYNNKTYFASTVSNNNNRKLVEATVTDGVVTASETMMSFTLGGSSTGWTFATDNYGGTAGYLNATNTTGSNNLKVVAELDNYAYFTIEIASSGDASITCTGKSSKNIMYLNGSTCISCYNTQTTAQYKKLRLYKEVSAKPTVSFEKPTGGTLVVETNAAIESGDEVEAGTTVTVTATPGEGYKLPATITFYDENGDEIADPATDLSYLEDDSHNGGLFEMPDHNLTIAASFTAKAVSAVTVTDLEHGTITVTGAADLSSVMEGTVLSVSVTGSGYTFTPKAYKTGEETTVVAIDGEGKLTMPEYAITITADEEQITTPNLEADLDAVAFGDVSVEATVNPIVVTINGQNLKAGNLTVSLLYGTNFEITTDPATIAVDGTLESATITVTPKSTATVGDFEDLLTISGGGASDLDLNVTMSVKPRYTVSFSTGTGNPEVTSVREASYGAGITLPAGPTPACSDDDWEFAGWAEAEVTTATTTAPTLLSGQYNPTSDVTLYAVYKKVEDGVKDATKTETFDDQDAGTTYNSTQNYAASASNAGLAWTMYYGTVSTNDKITGDNSAQMRWYNSATSNKGYIQTTTALSGLQEVSFKARVSSTDVKVAVWYSTDGTNWTLNDDNLALDATGASGIKTFTSTINGTVGTNYYIKIGVSSGSTAPSSGNYKLIIDDVTFNYKEGSSTTTYLSSPTCSVKYNITIADDIQYGTVEANKTKASEDDEVMLTAHPATGYQLSAWSVMAGETPVEVNNNKFTMPASDVVVSATFAQANYTVTLEQTGGASATLSGATDAAHYNEEITVSATAVDGYYFIGWEATGITLENAKALSQTFNMPANNVSLTAKFAEILTVAEAVVLIKTSSTASNKVVEGYISEVGSYNSTYHSITYYLEDIDTNGFLSDANVIKVYSGKGLDNANFSSADDIEVGAKVRVLGDLLFYDPDYEINYNNYLLSYVAPENPSVEIYGTAAKTAYEVGDSFEFDGLSAKTVYDNDYATAIAEPSWAAEPATIAANTTSVSVTANGEGAKNIAITVLTHELTFNATPENGTVSVVYNDNPVATGDHFVKGDVLTITATPADGYELDEITVINTATSEDVTASVLSGLTITMPTFGITVNATFKALPAIQFYVAGTMTDWGTGKIAVRADSYVLEGLAADTEHKIKVVTTDDQWKGFDNLNAATVVSGIYAEAAGDANICFKLNTASDVTVTYVDGKISLTGDFTEQEVKVAGDDPFTWSGVVLDLAEDKLTASKTIESLAAKDYAIKMINGGNWFGNGGTINRENRSAKIETNITENMKLVADKTGNYTFTWNFATRTLTITFPDHSYTVAWSLAAGPDETLGELERQFDPEGDPTDSYTLTMLKDVLQTGTFNVKVFEDDATTPIATTTLNIAKVGKYYLEFDFHYNGNESTVTATATYDREPTGVDETGDGQKAVKVMKDNTIYIIRGDKTYTITGQVVK